MSTIETFALIPVNADEIAATDLHSEAANGGFDCYRVESGDTAEIGWLIFADGRAGVAWGGDAQWTDASSAEDAAERFLGLGGKEMCN